MTGTTGAVLHRAVSLELRSDSTAPIGSSSRKRRTMGASCQNRIDTIRAYNHAAAVGHQSGTDTMSVRGRTCDLAVAFQWGSPAVTRL